MRCLVSFFLSPSRGKAPGVDGVTAEVFGAGGRPMAMLLQPLFAGVCLQKSSAHHVEGGNHGNHSEWKEQDERRIRPKLLQIEPLWVARSQAIGSARRGAVYHACFFDDAKIRGLSAAAVFCDLAAAYYSVIRQYAVGTDLPEQRLLVLMDILGLDPV